MTTHGDLTAEHGPNGDADCIWCARAKIDQLLRACGRAVPWLAKAIGDGAFVNAVSPHNAQVALNMLEEALAGTKPDRLAVEHERMREALERITRMRGPCLHRVCDIAAEALEEKT